MRYNSPKRQLSALVFRIVYRNFPNEEVAYTNTNNIASIIINNALKIIFFITALLLNFTFNRYFRQL